MSTTEPASQAKPYGWGAKVAHWGFILLFIYALTKQLDEVEELEDSALLHYEMAFAVVFLLVLLARFVFMRATQPSALPDTTPPATRRWVRAGHLAMYISLAGIAVTGLIIGGLYGAGIKAGFGMDAVLLLHEIAVNGSYLLILGHVVAALYHRSKRDGLWDAMVPVWKERPRD